MSSAVLLKSLVIAATLQACRAGGDHDHGPAPAPAAATHIVSWVIPGAHTHGDGHDHDHGTSEIMPGENATITVNVGDTVHFKWDGNWNHDLQEMAGSAALADCIFTSATEIHASTKKGDVSVTMSAPGTKYYSCSVTGHCTSQQKIKVEAVQPTSSSTTRALLSFLAFAGQTLWTWQ
mmetsp:Transcript_153337/g.282213  ORF Transcript_153337/g.282213 Transcript_153337/m.282213 type:complete len:178 (-) Transcript_153337:94-627(-)